MQLRGLPAVISLLIGLSPALSADTMMLIRTTETPSNTDVTRSVWIGKDRIRQDAPGQSMIVDLAADRVLVLDHRRRSYSIFDLPLELDDIVSPEEAAMIRAEAASMAMEVEIRPSEERKQIRELPCRRVDVTMRHPEGMRVDVELWTTDAIEFDIAAYKRMTSELAVVQTAGADWMQQLLDIGGFPVLREMVFELPGGKQAIQKEELVSVENREAPDGIYSAPPDYELTTEVVEDSSD